MRKKSRLGRLGKGVMGVILVFGLFGQLTGTVVDRPLEVWWGPYRWSEQLVDGGEEGWRFVQAQMDGYILHGAYWNYATSMPSPGVLGPKLAAVVSGAGKPVMLEHLLAGLYPNIDSPFGEAFAGGVADVAGYGTAVSNIRRLVGYGFPVPAVSTDYIVNSWEEAVRWHPEWTREEFFTARSGNWETYEGTQFDGSVGSEDRRRYGWFRQWVERLAEAFPGIRVTATNSPVYFSWEEAGVVRRELGGGFNNFFTWLKLERRGNEVRALFSGEGGGWVEFGRGEVAFDEEARVGLVTASGTSGLAEGRFDNVRVYPFFTADVGRPGRSGKVEASGGVFTVESNGDHALHPGNNRADAHTFVYRDWNGDGTFTARLYSLTGSNSNRTNAAGETPTAGITLRASLAAGARQVSLHANLANQLEFLARVGDGLGLSPVAGSGSPVAGAGAANAARWLRLTRAGNQVTAYHSADGVAWVTLGSVTVDLGEVMQVGLVADSQVSFERATAGFSDVSFLDSPGSIFSGASIGAAGAASSSLSGTSATLRSGGAGLSGTADAFRFHSTPLSGDATLVARLHHFANALNSAEPVSRGARMGVAIRAGTSAGAAQFAALFTPEDGLMALSRPASGAALETVGRYGEDECGIEPLGGLHRPLLHYFTGNDYLRTLHEAFPGEYSANFAGFTTDSPYAGYQKWGGSEVHPDAVAHRRKIVLYERWLQAQGREHHFIANSAGGTDFNAFNAGTQAGRDAWDALYKQQSLRSLQLHQLEGGRPDKVLFESWYAGPFTLVPETREGTFTNLVRDGLLYIKGIGQELDLSIGLAEAATLGGGGRQETVPSTDQRVVAVPGEPGTIQRWRIRLQNRGTVAALPVLQAIETGTGDWGIQYRLGDAVVTADITASNGLLVTDSAVRGAELIAPGASVELDVQLTAPANPSAGSIEVRAYWNPQDPGLVHRDAVRIDVSAPDAFAAWTSGIQWAGGDAAPEADPDGDGMSNLLEYALGTNPLVGSRGPSPLAGMSTGLRLTLSFERIADPALTYEVLGSTNLSTWSSVWSSTGVLNVPGPVVVEDTELLQDHPARFMKLEINRQP